jgi:hypothetical protein
LKPRRLKPPGTPPAARSLIARRTRCVTTAADSGTGVAKKNGEDGLTKRVAYRLSEDDYAAYLAKVEQSGLSKSEFFREAILRNKTRIVARTTASVDKKRLLHIFAKTSNNLNQMAHRANSEHVQGKLSEATYEQLLYQLETIAKYLRTTLNHVD